ncbi:MAG: translation initiation factor IF-2 associated domain-containing protein, partial [Xanthobacteraceae bacterium]|nr:translation initiation factor IF-2 associated domain-containing protein [Xanthobacteraceae bacterium]
MTDTNKNPGEKLTVAPSKPLSLKRSVEQGVVRQSFSHGRSKAVVVEKVKRRVGPGEGKVEAAPPPAPAAAPAPSAPAPTARRSAPPPAGRGSAAAGPAPRSSGVVLRTLTDEERNARAHALADAKVREAEERKIAEEEARRRVERETRERAEREASEARKREEDERRRHDEETKKRAEEEAKKRFGDAEAKPATTPTPTAPTRTPVDVRSIVPEVDEDEAPRPRRGGAPGRPAPAPAPKPTRGGTEKRRGRLTLVTALAADEVRERSVASFRRRVQRMTGHRDTETKEKIARDVVIPESITIQELAN